MAVFHHKGIGGKCRTAHKDGAMQSLNEIAENQYEAIAAYCLKRTGGDEQLARECAAEVFLRAEKLGDPPKHPNICGWLRRTARNVVHEMLRERKEYYRRNVSLEKLLEDGWDVTAPFFEREDAFLEGLWANGAEDEETEKLKRELLALLPPRDRELIELAYEKRLPLGEMAARLGKSKDAVRVMLSRLTDRVTNMVRNYFDADNKEAGHEDP